MENIEYNFYPPYSIEKILEKSSNDFTIDDLVELTKELDIHLIYFHYFGIDGKIRTLHIPIKNKSQLIHTLRDGERVDGSSLFKGLVQSGKSDLYVVPIYSTAFLDPDAEEIKALHFVCKFFDKDGNMPNFAPDNILYFLANKLKNLTGFELYAHPELEYYLISEPNCLCYKNMAQSGYHASSPYIENENLLDDMALAISNSIGNLKYAHYEVGIIEKIESEYPELNGKRAEQMEIELGLSPIERTAYETNVGMWIVRSIAKKHNAIATFYPKLEVGHAGSGLHFHLALMKDGKNIMTDKDGALSEDAKLLIGGLLKYGKSLTAFGNSVIGSYMRLVPNQEAPTRVCWSEQNRNAMIRVPLAWANLSALANRINPHKAIFESNENEIYQTVEIRTPDGSANVALLLAGITKAIYWAYKNKKEALTLCDKYHFDGTLFEQFESIADSCESSADALLDEIDLYLSENDFQPAMLERVASTLKSEKDKNKSQFIANLSQDEKNYYLRKIIHKDLIEKNI
ncbi:MAG TPA: glutamine synthetase family protein [Bacteroidota bacterium]|nr:glutamine synthetase family protein [Bacteroidota bacterium]